MSYTQNITAAGTARTNTEEIPMSKYKINGKPMYKCRGGRISKHNGQAAYRLRKSGDAPDIERFALDIALEMAGLP